MNSCRRLSIFTSLVMFVGALSLVVASLTTDYWFESTPINEKGGLNKNNFVHSGLLKGSRQLDWGLGPRYKPFSVYEEIHEGYGFVSKTPWIFTIFFIALGLLWNVVGIIICLVNTVIKENDTVAGPIGIYLWSMLACKLVIRIHT
ncbi:hypothetical protein Tcan_03732 [Toxocara canis]|uniref:Uncharacterized protein n=2 Tax=Toxocara canis TaxID=6265 RepID=A0A0B2UZN4_TOXCA|nr:hypothetical protein Tcan_03732 [Toxocara canis]VDM29001.1 unnamed protein product [Toxocara canis]